MLLPSTPFHFQLLVLSLLPCILADSITAVIFEQVMITTIGVIHPCSGSSCSTLAASPSSSSTPTTLSTSSTSSTSVSSTSTAVSSSATTTTTSSPISSLTTTQAPWTSIETDPAKYNMAITTTYTQSPQCTLGNITQMAFHGTYLWENDIYPVETSTITTCYPSQFYSSVMAHKSSLTLPAFSALVCPYNWETITYNETYGVCCPYKFGVYAENYHLNTDRPFLNAVCTSRIEPQVLYDITSYDSTAYWTDFGTSAGDYATYVSANAFDGILFTAKFSAPASATAIPTSTTSSSATSATGYSLTSISLSSPSSKVYNSESSLSFGVISLASLSSILVILLGNSLLFLR